MTLDITADGVIKTRLQNLKQATTGDHQHIDDMVMEMAPFESRDNYARFVGMQYVFHRAVKPLYDASDLNDLIPGLSVRSRFDHVCADLADLQCSLPENTKPFPVPKTGMGRLGWLYVCEGSSLGAAFLLKAAGNIGLNAEFGARHLAGHEDGRGKHWREFVDQVNGLALSTKQEQEVIAGAIAAFDFFRTLLIEDRKLAA
ncbi:biliverdin-producing heme oxygenase [Thalassospira xianhensis]|uniref:Heme oxygenase n=1 Tax=Thalassospira xianhensis MCCC 1A02616 TaxID=1177929 RepID=A0A367UGW0_9PROT|nr:biliverdin-producing heme oxygenase [Thalassospira xianhensis]RCK07241.1 heme oxygenase [Thalassospira xianhensis MCCC 1A02616]UKV14622.1 biliverdin-producing heme oxygenase [Thalassospiraceae bacterium SW-3-3]